MSKEFLVGPRGTENQESQGESRGGAFNVLGGGAANGGFFRGGAWTEIDTRGGLALGTLRQVFGTGCQTTTTAQEDTF